MSAHRIVPDGFPAEAFSGVNLGTSYNPVDNGPYYVITPGEPVHRVDARDSVPHIYPMQVAMITNAVNWTHPDYSSQQNVILRAKNREGYPIEANATYAGWINHLIVNEPCWQVLGTVSIQAFAKRHGRDHEEGGRMVRKDFDLDEFNQLICPEPLWWNLDEVPPSRLAEYKELYPVIADEVRREGAFNRRERLLKEAYAKTTNPLYQEAIREILQGCAIFRNFALPYLSRSDAEIKSGEDPLRKQYDVRDLRFQWLFAKKGVDTALTDLANREAQPIIVQPPAELPFKLCEDCGNKINLMPDGSLPRRGCIACGWNPSTPTKVDDGPRKPPTK